MANDEPNEPAGGVRWTVPGHFANCWRGKNGIGETFLASVIVFAAINIPLGFLTQYARDASWPQTAQSAILWLGVIGAILTVTWFAVSMWRSARRDFLLGKRFWPIVASLIAVLAATAFMTRLVVGFIDGLMR
jgi:hypothetical protein